MYAKVHLGYVEGRRRTVPDSGQPLYGNVVHHWHRSQPLLELWPHDFPLAAREAGTGVRPLAILWRPEYSGVFVNTFAVAGLERCRRGDRVLWFAQRWMIEPMTAEDLRQATAETDRRYGAVPSVQQPSTP